MTVANKGQFTRQSRQQPFRITPFWAILAGAVFLRVVWAALVPIDPVSDSFAYQQFTAGLLEGRGYSWQDGAPTAFWPVGTSAAYAMVYWLLGQSAAAAVAFHLLLTAGILTATLYLGTRWVGRPAALTACLLLAIWPMHIEFTTVIASELIFTALLLAALCVWESRRLSWWWQALLLGTAVAAASYVRPTALLLPVVLACSTVFDSRRRWHGIKTAGACVLVAGLLIAPWSIRNAHAFGEFVPISTNAGVNLWMGNNPASRGSYTEVPAAFAGMNEAERDRRLGAAGRQYIIDHPGRFVLNTGFRLVDTFGQETIGVHWNEPGLKRAFGTGVLLPLKVAGQVFWMGVLGLGLWGSAMLVRRQGWRSAVFHSATLTILYFVAVHSLIVSQDRYHFPVTPLIALLAGFALCSLLRHHARKARFGAVSPI